MIARLYRIVLGLISVNISYVLKIYFLNKNKNKNNFGLNFPLEVLNNANCVFVLSTGRCGTMLLTKLFDKCAKTRVFHNPAPILLYPSKELYSNNFNCKKELNFGILCARYELVRESYVDKKVYIETNNRITFFAYSISKVFNNSVFIHLIRSPQEFVLSGIKRGYYSNSVEDEGRITPVPGNKAYEAWSEMTQIEKISWLWNETNQFIEDFKSSTSSSRVITVFSNELFTSELTFNRICTFLNLDSISNRNIKNIIKRPVNKENRKTFDVYEKWSEDEKNQLKKWTPLAKKYGYDLY
jgi:hypothetical protein